VRKQRQFLEDDRDGARVVVWSPRHFNRAGVATQRSGYDADESGFASAVAAEQRMNLAVRDAKVCFPQDIGGAETFLDVGGLENVICLSVRVHAAELAFGGVARARCSCADIGFLPNSPSWEGLWNDGCRWRPHMTNANNASSDERNSPKAVFSPDAAAQARRIAIP